jgi:hypothetical protein
VGVLLDDTEAVAVDGDDAVPELEVKAVAKAEAGPDVDTEAWAVD